MGANQSGQPPPSDTNQHGILVVNERPGEKSAGPVITLPKRVPPVLTVDGHNIDPERHPRLFQIDSDLWVDYVKTIHEYSNSRSDLVAARQSQLQEKIILLDDHVQNFTDSYVNDTHKALAKMNDDCRRVEEINRLLHKCHIQSELCVDMLNKMNILLPPEHKMENLEP